MRVLTMGVALLVLVACYGGGSDVQQAGSATGHDPAMVRSALDSANARLAMAMTQGDTATLNALYADSAILMPQGMPMARGRGGIAETNAGLFAAFTVTNASFNTTDLIVADDYAIETGTYQMTLKPKTAGAAMPDTGKYISVWQRQADGSWKMIRDIFNSDLSQH